MKHRHVLSCAIQIGSRPVVVQQRSVQVENRLSGANDVGLSRAEVAMLIDALLQASATLCAVDDRFVSVHTI